MNYDIYNKELLAIVAALKEWRAFLQGITELFTRMIKKDKLWKWGMEQKELFAEIKREFTKELILRIY